MRKSVKKIVMGFACLLFVFGMYSTAFAEDTKAPEVIHETKTYVNPLYEDVLDESDLNKLSDTPALMDEEYVDYYLSVEGAGADVCEQMIQRKELVEVHVIVDSYYDELAEEVAAWAMVHTGYPTEGDYLLWQYGGWECEISYYTMDEETYVSLYYAMTYYTTAAQEEELTKVITSVLDEMDLEGKSDYEIVKAIYDYICANVSYDNENLNDDSYLLKNTAYAAMINKKAVCQGYALLFYRMALECGIDNRVIAGVSFDEGHGWNIVNLDDKYYNLDTTWDAGETEYSYFLKCNANFADHTRWDVYDSEDFNTYYPMATEDYVVKDEEPDVEDPTGENPFVDIKETDYYYDAVLWAFENGITTGKDATHFLPTGECTRAQVVTFLWRSQGQPEPETTENPFTDVNTSNYYYKAVLWAYENGITTGKTETEFQPDAVVNRSQFVTFLWRAEGEPAVTIDNPFEDVSAGQYYTDAVLWAYENGITQGKDATHFQPFANCQRCQVVTFLYRAYEQ